MENCWRGMCGRVDGDICSVGSGGSDCVHIHLISSHFITFHFDSIFQFHNGAVETWVNEKVLLLGCVVT